MNTSKAMKEKTQADDATSDEIAQTAKMASLAFDGQSLSDVEIDELCEAVVYRDEERRRAQKVAISAFKSTAEVRPS